MLTTDQKTAVIEVFGKHYSGKIVNHLTKKKILNAKGEPYRKDNIGQIVRGERENEVVEFEIAKLLASEKKKRLKMVEKKNQYFNN